MKVDYIFHRVAEIDSKYHIRDPFALASLMGILLLRTPMGKQDESCKGFFLASNGERSITVNSDLPDSLQRIICAHEIGHAVLHANESELCAFHDFSMLTESGIKEYEANLFAAEYLLDDDNVINLLNEECSFFSAAARLCVPPELLDFKFRVLNIKGYKFNTPFVSDSCFLKNVDVKAYE